MPELVTPNVGKLEILTSLVAVGGVFAGAKVVLSKSDFDLGKDTVRGDIDDADYDGNGDEAIAWGVPSLADDGTAEVIGIVGEFRPTGATTPNTIYGGAIASATDTLLAAFKTNPVVPVQTTRDSYIPTVRLRYEERGLVVEVT